MEEQTQIQKQMEERMQDPEWVCILRKLIEDVKAGREAKCKPN